MNHTKMLYNEHCSCIKLQKKKKWTNDSKYKWKAQKYPRFPILIHSKLVCTSFASICNPYRKINFIIIIFFLFNLALSHTDTQKSNNRYCGNWWQHSFKYKLTQIAHHSLCSRNYEWNSVELLRQQLFIVFFFFECFGFSFSNFFKLWIVCAYSGQYLLFAKQKNGYEYNKGFLGNFDLSLVNSVFPKSVSFSEIMPNTNLLNLKFIFFVSTITNQ